MRSTAEGPVKRRPLLRPEVLTAGAWGLLATAALAVLIVIGSRNLAYFDAALIGYTFGTLFAVFGVTYRYAMWLQRPPTRLYWLRGWQSFLNPRYALPNLVNWVRRMITDVALNRFIWRRSPLRGLAHALIMWGCVIAALITFPLVFGWLHFQTVPDDLERYRIFVFGFPTTTFPIDSVMAFMIFHGLVWSAFLVMAGVMLAMRRRMRDEGAAAVQRFGEDILPLVLLFAISLTGLLLTASYTWMKGYAYDFLALLHAATVIFTLIWLPFGKFFHIFQRPAQLGVSFYKDVGQNEAAALCRRCGQPFTSAAHVTDLIAVERALGYDYAVDDPALEHYQWICPPCRRAMVALAQGHAWQAARGLPADGAAPAPAVTPRYVNPAVSEGPLGVEDARNFHP
jgi:hypothetical protein